MYPLNQPIIALFYRLNWIIVTLPSHFPASRVSVLSCIVITFLSFLTSITALHFTPYGRTAQLFFNASCASFLLSILIMIN